MGKRKIKIKQMVRAPRERVFAALTEPGRLREWLCDQAWAEPHLGGRNSPSR